MRFLTVSVITIVSFISLGAQQIEGKLGDEFDQEHIYLYEFYGKNIRLADSIKIKKGNFELKELPHRGLYSLGFNPKNSVRFISDDNIKFDFKTKPITSNENTIESDVNASYQRYQNRTGEYFNFIKELNTRLTKAPASVKSDKDKLQEYAQSVRNSYDSINEDFYQFHEELIATHPDSYLAKMLDFVKVDPNDTRLSYIEKNKISNEEMIWGDLISYKINMHYTRFLGNDPGLFKSEATRIIGLSAPGTPNREVTYQSFIDLFSTFDNSFAVELARDYVEQYENSEYAKELKSRLPGKAPGIGDKAPDIALKDPEGNMQKLSDLKGKVVLLDFWASWCGPCRRENPNVVAAYNEFKEKGFTVFSVSLDKDKSRWVNAISSDNLVWPSHVSDLRGWQSQGAALYQVRSIPATFLIDQEGFIVAKNLRGKRLEEKLKELLSDQ